MSRKDEFYPNFSELLVPRLLKDFPDKLPEKQISDYQLGYLIGQQSIIKKLQFEYNKLMKEYTPDEDEE